MADDTKLATALRQAKQTPMFFAFVAKGSTEGVLIVAKKKIPAKEINEAKAESGGKKVFRGRCTYEDGKMVFEMGTEPPGTLAKQLKAVINEAAGMMMQVETRVAADLQDEEGEENESVEAGVIPPAPPLQPGTAPQPTPTTPPDPATARVAARLKALEPIVQRVAATKHASATEAKLAFSEAGSLLRSNQADLANKTLNIVEGLVKEALAAGNANAAPTAPTQNDAGATRFAARLKLLAPIVPKAEATGSAFAGQAKAQIAAANKLYIAKQYNEANAALDAAEKLIKQAFAGTAQPSQGFTAALAAWQSAREQVVARLRELAKEVGAEQHPDAAKGEIEIKSVITNLTVAPSALKQVVSLERYLIQDDVVFDVCDLAYDFRTPLLTSLNELKAQLPN